MLLRSLTAIAVTYMLVGAVAKAFEVAWSQTTGVAPRPAAWLAVIAVISVAAGWTVGFVAGFAPLRHAVALAGVAVGLGVLTLVLAGGPSGARLSLLSCLAAGVMVGGLLRRWQRSRATVEQPDRS